ncbi:TetR/AcrR family transcriptional regulator [Georgenia phoenicis]|uniref:TetR/AcrR family transcriptional regulator n=1 Tax=unclassified Georgenia TaxID=2626815 RepID=UPI0039B03D26
MDDGQARERILAAADELYYAKGYAAVGMAELRAAAGVSLRRLYALFPSKNDIVKAVLARRHEAWKSGVTSRVDAAGPSARERLLAVYSYLEEWFGTEGFRGCAFINAFGEIGGNDPEAAEIIRAHKAGFQRYMAGLVAELGAPALLADQLSLLAEGAQSTAAISGDPAVAAQARSAAEVLIDASLAA